MTPKTPFQHIDAIFTNQNTKYYDNLNDLDKKSFNVYIINLGISMNPHFVPIVNEVNKYWDEMGPREVYLFYSQILPKGKQYNKWIKGSKDKKYEEWVIEKICKHFEISSKEAIDYLDIYYSTDSGREHLKTLLEGYGISPKQIKKLRL